MKGDTGHVTSPTAQWSEQTYVQNSNTTTTTTTTTITTNTTTSIGEFPQQVFVQYAISDALLTLVPPLLLLLGTFGNVMTVLVMRALTRAGGGGGGGNQLGDPSMGVYFPCLAVSDQIVLTVGLGRKWMKAIGLYDVRTLHVLICKMHKFVVYAGSRTSTWILVAVTSQRVLTVTWPLRQRLSSTRKRALGVVTVIVAACSVLDSAIFLLYSHVKTASGHIKCQPVASSPEMAYFEDLVYPWMRIVSGSLLPLLILILNNAILAYKVRLSAKAWRPMKHSKQGGTPATKPSALSLTLIATSLAFFVLTSPISADFIIQYNIPGLWSRDYLKADAHLADTVLDLLWYCNSAVNFYLYFLTGPTFRQEARSLLCAAKNAEHHLKNSSRKKTPSTVDNALTC